MPTNTKVAGLPIPGRDERVDGPGAFASFARRLDDITVVAYDTATVRAQAYTNDGRAPTEGTLSYRRDADVFEFYDGAVWQLVLPATTPRGVVGYAASTNEFPGNDVYITQGSEVVVSEMTINVPCVLGRAYRLWFYSSIVDGGPGSSITSGGAQLRLRYTTTLTGTPSTSATALFEARAQTIADSATQSTSAYLTGVWTAPATQTYRFLITLNVFNSGGVRLSGRREVGVEDIGRLS